MKTETIKGTFAAIMVGLLMIGLAILCLWAIL